MSDARRDDARHPSAEVLLAPLLAFLGAPRCAVLASLNADDTPHQVVVHYLLAGDHLLVNGTHGRRWVENLRRDRRVAVLVHDSDDALHWIGIRGRVDGPVEGREAVEDAMRIARRYGEDPAGYEGLRRVSFTIMPERISEYGAPGPEAE